jgi:thioredoxin-related protein
MKVKSFLILSLILSFVFNMAAQDVKEPIEQKFEFTNSWKKALQAAKSEKKVIFIQFITDNCPPCNKLKNEIWTDVKLADIYAEYFILLKPKIGSKDAKDLEKKYKIHSYPTSIFVDPNSKIVHKYLGFVSSEIMIQMAENVHNNKNTLAYFERMMKSKEASNNPDLLFEYANALMHAGEDYKKIAEKYFKTQNEEDLRTAQNLKAIMQFSDDMYSREFGFLARNIDVYEGEGIDRNQIIMKVEDVISNSLMKTLAASPKVSLDDTLNSIFNYFDLTIRDLVQSRVEMDYYDIIKHDKSRYFQSMEVYMNTHLAYMNSMEIADRAEQVLLESDDKIMINNAVLWINEAMIRQESPSEELYTISIKLLASDGRYQEANDILDMLSNLWSKTGISDKEALRRREELTEYIDSKMGQMSDEGNELEINR